MAIFRYRALTPSGAVVTGEIDAASRSDVIRAVQERGHYPIDAEDHAAAKPWDWRALLAKDIFPHRTVSRRSVLVATQELAALLKAGLELERALEILVSLDETKAVRPAFTHALARVRDGASLADALSETSAFPKFYVNIVRAGEQSGNLQAALEQLGEYLGRTYAVREAVISALIYPMVLLATAGASIVIVLVFVLPSFTPLFAEAGKTLPLATRIVMGVGQFLTDWGWALLLGAALAGLVLNQALREPRFRRRWDAGLLRMPLLGDLLRKIDIERFSRTLGTLVVNGVGLPQALLLTGDTLANSVIADAVRDASTSLKEGDSLSRNLREGGMFPTLALDMMRVGEETGQLGPMLLREAELYEREIRNRIDRMVALLVPCLTIFMGFLVAGLISSILVAILSINDLVN